MADWFDGSSETSDETLQGFAMPDAPNLITPNEGPAEKAELPDDAPLFEDPAKAAALEEIQPQAVNKRDPNEPFNSNQTHSETEFDPTQPLATVDSSEIQSSSAWGSASNRYIGPAGTVIEGRYLPPPTGQPVAPISQNPYPMQSGNPVSQNTQTNAQPYPQTANQGYPPQGQYVAPGQGNYPDQQFDPYGRTPFPTPPMHQGLATVIPPQGPLNLGQAIRVPGIRVYLGVVLGLFFPNWAIWGLIFSWLNTNRVPRFGPKLNQLIAAAVFVRFVVSMAGMFLTSLPYGFITTFTLMMCWGLLFGLPAYVYYLARQGKA